jgi:hypothetical protein
MKRMVEFLSKHKLQYSIFAGISAGVTALTCGLYFSRPGSFRRFLGGLDPLVAVFLLIVIGFVLLTYLRSKTEFSIYTKGGHRSLPYALGLAIPFAIVAVLTDLAGGFPRDINIPFPSSLLFYPVIGFVAEIVFHVVPLTLLLFVLRDLAKRKITSKIVWACIICVSLLEPAYQMALGHYTVLSGMITGLNVYLISVFQLSLFRRYDFVSMYSFRLVYYFLWHIVWGYLRLKLLF